MTDLMRAWVYTKRGLPSQVLSLQEIARPKADDLGPKQVLVQVHHVGFFTPFGYLMSKLPHVSSKHWIPELEFAGIVAAVGAKVTRVNVGDEVFGGQDPDSHLKLGGVAAEEIIIPEGCVTRRPVNMTAEEASGLAPVGCTAIQFTDLAGLKPGNKVLITAAGSITGMALVQVVRSIVGPNGIIIGTVSKEREVELKRLGCDETIDYRTTTNLHGYLTQRHSDQPFDAIFDFAGSDDQLYDRCPEYLTSRGTFLFGGNIAMTHSGSNGLLDFVSWTFRLNLKIYWPRILGGTPRKGIFHSARVEAKSLDRVRDLARDGLLKMTVEEVFEMENALKAYEKLMSGHAKGKNVLRVRPISTTT